VHQPKVFVSYTHDSDEHVAAVLEFATFLTEVGIDPILDQWVGVARQDWYAWATAQMLAADFILVVASEGYQRMGDGNGPNDRNLGGQAEATLLRDLLQRDRAKWTPKILPVVLPGHDIDQIPNFLQPYTADHYRVKALTTDSADSLLRAITGQAAHLRPPLGPLVSLPPRSGPGAAARVVEPRWMPLTPPPPVFWRTDLDRRLRSPWQAILEFHAVPVEPGERIGIAKLEAAQSELAKAGRSHGLFATEDGLSTGYSGDGAWAHLTDQGQYAAGLAIHRNGQRTGWFPLHRANIGSIFDREVIAEKLTEGLAMFMDLSFAMPSRVGFALGIEPVSMVRLGRISEASANRASIPTGRQERVRVEPDDAVSVDDLRGMTRIVADELVARLAVLLK
jgi:hypothetical protein